MKVPEFVRGNIVPVFTAFDEKLALDDDGQRNFLDFLYDRGDISAYFVRSGLGLMYCFALEEVKHLAALACRHMEGRAPVLVGCNGIWDRNRDAQYPAPATFISEAVELSQYAESIGASGVVHTVPEAVVPEGDQTVEDVFLRYFEAIAQATRLPIFIYQPPGTDPRYLLTPSLLARLADMDTVAGAKVANTNAEYLFELARATRGKDFAFITGAETAMYTTVSLGSRAAIAGGSAVNPRILRLLIERYEQDDWPGVLEAQESINRLLFACSNPVDFLKLYATEKGYPVGVHTRIHPNNPYVVDREPLTETEYTTFKVLLESELARYT